jgi:pyrroline-5-carboxylate reductase
MNIYIIGTGVMGGAIAKILAKTDGHVFIYNKTYAKAAALRNNSKIIVDKNLEHLHEADFVLLAVKPYQLADLSIKAKLKPSAVLVSIAAGVKISTLKTLFSHKKIIRLMPNLGLAVGQGVAAWKSSGLSAKDKISSQRLLKAICENFEVKDEFQIDAVTAISGGGPAYFFYFAQALQQAAVKLGFDKTRARQLVEKTFSAAAALQGKTDYQFLINRVASKKGTTERALHIFNKDRLSHTVLKAAFAAQKRAQEISNE